MNPYTLLGLSPDCTDEEITKAFRELSKEHHPDVGGNSDVFIQINIAVSILRDPHKRQMFDEYGLCFDVPEDSINKMVADKFNELVNHWIDMQIQTNGDIDISKFFTSKLTEVKNNINNQIQKHQDILKALTERMEEIYVEDGEVNMVVQIIKSKIDGISSILDKMKSEEYIVDLLQKKCSKYSSKEMQVMSQSSSPFIYQTTNTGSTVFYRGF